MRVTPFSYVFGDIAARFPAIAEVLQQEGVNATARDRFVLLEPVGRLLRDIVPRDAGPDALEAHVLLLHHAFLFWAAGQRVYAISEARLREAVGGTHITTATPDIAQYLQLPELRVWGAPNEGVPVEPLDGMFVSRTETAGEIAVLAIFGMRPDRPGFSAVGLEGRANRDDPTAGEIEIAAVREDGTAPFAPTLAGGAAAGLYSVANPGELLLLTCRLVALLDSGLLHEHESRDGQDSGT
ncbi:MAG TPA: hypothetical protein VE714_09375 [Gemmatimonadales bacterium]|jgi:hypothetical protein|nr:hypothetical protein [Gemmatimonadales bacterium]